MRPLYRSKAVAPAKVQAALFFLPSFRTFVHFIYYHSFSRSSNGIDFHYFSS
nr:MAG TPA: hypothetical protein [Caudoviricetes sp.]